jgi:hypothetical protein
VFQVADLELREANAQKKAARATDQLSKVQTQVQSTQAHPRCFP